MRIHVAEPWTFERGNGTCDLSGWTDDHHRLGQEEWVVHLNEPFTIEDEQFHQVMISPRYHGETLHRVMDRLVNLTVNIVPHGRRWKDQDERSLAMVGTVAQGWDH